jgi:transposase
MIEFINGIAYLVGPHSRLEIQPGDDLLLKIAMIHEGECEGLGARLASQKFGYSIQRYYQLLRQFREKGSEALRDQKRGPQTTYRRTDEVIRQVIRHRFLDPDASAQVIAQKLQQAGWPIGIRSVERIIADFGLQKKTPHVLSNGINR